MVKLVKEVNDIDVTGSPVGYSDGDMKGFFIWFDPAEKYWEIRLNGDQSGKRHVAKGNIVADHIEVLEEYHWDHDQEGEEYKVSDTGRRSELLFNCSVNGHVDGLKIRASGNYLTFYLQCGTVLSADETVPWTARDIYIGANSHPVGTHFILLLDQDEDE